LNLSILCLTGTFFTRHGRCVRYLVPGNEASWTLLALQRAAPHRCEEFDQNANPTSQVISGDRDRAEPGRLSGAHRDAAQARSHCFGAGLDGIDLAAARERNMAMLGSNFAVAERGSIRLTESPGGY
jgi:hypothetical protein